MEAGYKNTVNCVFREGRERVARDGSYLLQPRTSRLEMSVSYGFFTYWTVVARTPNRLPSAISDHVLWLLLSRHSALNDDERRQFTNDLWDPEPGLKTLPNEVQQRYREAVVPPGLFTRDFCNYTLTFVISTATSLCTYRF